MSLPPSEVPQGAIRFNTDSQKLEFYAQGEWWVMSTDTPNLGTSGDPTPGVRGVFMGGHNEPDPSQVWDIIDYVNIASTGNAVDFGNLLAAEQEGNAFSSSTRGFHFGGDPADNEIETIVFASTGNATDFGNLTATSKTGIGLASATRGIAFLNNGNVINYVTMASTGAGIDFGDNEIAKGAGGSGCASPTRGIFVDGDAPASGSETIAFITIATLGDAQDFGDQTYAKGSVAAASNATRGVMMGGFTPTAQKSIDYITISTLGNATNFGDLITANYYGAASSSSTRAICGGGGAPITNTIEYVQIPTTGDAVDFGDLTQKRRHLDACSNGHGGL
jgi:hypothetical protein